MTLNWIHNQFNICIYFHSGNTIDNFIGYYPAEWPNGTIPPKLHMLQGHATDFVEKWKTGFGIYAEKGGDVIHNELNQL